MVAVPSCSAPRGMLRGSVLLFWTRARTHKHVRTALFSGSLTGPACKTTTGQIYGVDTLYRRDVNRWCFAYNGGNPPLLPPLLTRLCFVFAPPPRAPSCHGAGFRARLVPPNLAHVAFRDSSRTSLCGGFYCVCVWQPVECGQARLQPAAPPLFELFPIFLQCSTSKKT